jgi:hypothetical protein
MSPRYSMFAKHNLQPVQHILQARIWVWRNANSDPCNTSYTRLWAPWMVGHLIGKGTRQGKALSLASGDVILGQGEITDGGTNADLGGGMDVPPGNLWGSRTPS